MKKNEIKVNGLYAAKVSGNFVTVRVDDIRERRSEGYGPDRTVYECTNLDTGRKVTFRSAARFRSGVTQAQHACPKKNQFPECGKYAPCPHVDVDDPGKTIVVGGSPVGGNAIGAKPTGGQHTAPASADCPPLPAIKGDEQSPNPTKALPAPSVAASAVGTPALGSNVSKKLGSLLGRSNSVPHLIVEARAGTGKTTTLISAMKVMKGINPGIVPSTQQQEVWDRVALSKDAKTIAFVAFNKSIATELQARVPAGCQAMTMHSMGNRVVTMALGYKKIDQFRVQEIICELLGKDIRDLRKNKATTLKATDDLVSLCKMNLVDGLVESELDALASHHNIELEGCRTEVFGLVPQVLEQCKNPSFSIDYDDMIWLPVALKLPVPKFDVLFVDESQDLNRCQQALARIAGRRLILCGDPKQAIYGFAGADSESMSRMYRELKATPEGCDIVPLTVTRRCGKAIVEEAKRIVPDFEAHETNPGGSVKRYSMKPVTEGASIYRDKVEDGNMVLCRTNAPLVSECFKFLKAGRKANIQGRDIGKGLVALIQKLIPTQTERMANNSIQRLITLLDDWRDKEVKKEEAKRNPSEARINAIHDRYDCLVCFTDGIQYAEQVITKIESVFTDDKQARGIRLSSIHKAKGLEADRVFYLQPEGGGIRRDKLKSWELDQERNLEYVAITRAIHELVYVS